MADYTVLGIFENKNDAENAVAELEDAGFNPKDMSLIMRNKEEAQNIASEAGTNIAEGVVAGGILGGLAGLLLGISAITLPGIGPLIVGGPIAATFGLTGTAATTVGGIATGAIAGGIIGVLVDLGLPREQAQEYETQIKEGGILLAVPANVEDVPEARDILEENNADQVRSISQGTAHEALGTTQKEYPTTYVYAGTKGGKKSKSQTTRTRKKRS